MENDLIHILKELLFILIGPVVVIFAWIGKRIHNRIDKMQGEIQTLEKDSAVQYARLSDIKKDISNLDKKQDKTNEKIDKILERLSNKVF
jgi:peptidoglycan hydrolase CwlO-like protein